MELQRRCWALVAGVLCFAGQAGAQENYPVKPIKIVVPFSAGSATDLLSRMVAKELEPRLAQAVIVEARPGGNSTLGAAYVARSAPDGYTLLWAGTSPTSAAKALFKSLPYDPINDLAAVIIYGEAYFTFAVGPEEKETTFAQYLGKMRKDPGKNSIGGTNSTVEIISNMIDRSAKTGHTYVRYSQSPVMLADVMAGRLGAALHTFSETVPLVKSGKLRVLAVSSPVSVPGLPDAPTISTTLAGVSLGSFNGYFVPARTPRPIVQTLHKHLADVFQLPLLVTRVESGGRTLKMTPDEADAYVRSEAKRWNTLATQAGIRPE